MSGTNNAPAPPQAPNRPPVATQGDENAASDAQPDSPAKPARGKRDAASADADRDDADQTAPADTDPVALAARPLRPGDLGYAPPARVAMPAGEALTAAHYDWNPGRSTSAVNGAVPLAVPVATVPSLADNPNMMKPSLLSAPVATARLSQMVGDLSAWVMDFPHQVHGEAAVVVKVLRDLKARALAHGTAQALGRTVAADATDEASFTPPPEFFALRHAADQVLAVQALYAAALAEHGIILSAADQTTVDRIVAEFGELAAGPKAPEQA